MSSVCLRFLLCANIVPGSGVFGWMTEDEEDVWELDLDFGGVDPEESDGLDADMTIGELMEWRYFKAEKAKELVRDGIMHHLLVVLT